MKWCGGGRAAAERRFRRARRFKLNVCVCELLDVHASTEFIPVCGTADRIMCERAQLMALAGGFWGLVWRQIREQKLQNS